MLVWSHFAPFPWLGIGLAATEVGVCALSFTTKVDYFVQYGEALTGLRRSEQNGDAPILSETRSQLTAYIAGKLRSFDLPLDLKGTAFQTRTWRELLTLPYGQTVTYAELARRLEAPKAVRAVGAANGKNPVALIIPCHRVVAANGGLGGYAGGLPLKRWLLDLETLGGATKRPPL